MTDLALQRIIQSLNSKLRRDSLIGETVTLLRSSLQVDRVVACYFFWDGEGHFTYESVASDSYSTFGSTEPIDCLDDCSALFANGQVREIPHIAVEAMRGCRQISPHQLQARASLVAPIQSAKRLWGLLIAENFQASKLWSTQDVEMMEQSVRALVEEPLIYNG